MCGGITGGRSKKTGAPVAKVGKNGDIPGENCILTLYARPRQYTVAIAQRPMVIAMAGVLAGAICRGFWGVLDQYLAVTPSIAVLGSLFFDRKKLVCSLNHAGSLDFTCLADTFPLVQS